MDNKQNVTDSGVLSSEASDDATSLSLLERVKTQDGEAWRRLTRLYEPLVIQWCRWQRLQEADAADVCQEVFLAVARNIGAFRREPPHHTFRGWLRSITRNKIIDHWRCKQQSPVAAGGSAAQAALAAFPAEAPEDDSARHQEKTLLYQRALEIIETDFEPKTWQAFWHVVIDGRSPQDAAAELQTTANVVYLACSRVRKRLREEFADLLDN